MIESMILQKFISEKNWKRKQAQRQAQIGKKATIPSQKKSIKKKSILLSFWASVE